MSKERVYGPVLAGGWRSVGISAWAVVWLASLAAFLLAALVYYRWDSTPIAQTVLTDPTITPESQAFMTSYQNAIHQLGLSLPVYGGLFAGLRLLSGIPYFILSVLIMRRRSDRLMAVLFAVVLAVIGAAGRWIQANWMALPEQYPLTTVPLILLGFLLDCSVILFYTFPDGRFVPRWTRWFALAALLVSFGRNILPDTILNLDHLPGLWGSLPNRIFLLVGLFALAYRYRRDATVVQKQQIRWIMAGAVLLGVFYFAHYLIYNTPLLERWYIVWTAWDTLVFELALEPGWYVAQFLFAVCIGISLFRYRLWDFDLVINRVLVYGSLTLLTMGAYLVVVSALDMLFRGIADRLAFFLATGFVAILFDPLRQRLQRMVNRLMYGERDDPYAVLTHLSNIVSQNPIPGEVLPSIAAAIGQALKIPYVAIQIEENGENRAVAVYGSPQLQTLTFPLVYHGETVGALLVAPRARGEEFSTAERSLIENIAHQSGAAAQAARLNADLVRSRAEIVTVREEERRRLRRDLHDGLGPVLASQILKLGAARELVRNNQQRAESLIDDVIQQNEGTVSEVRRLVYGLRPPALDELGLVEAVRELVQRTGKDELNSTGLMVEVLGPQDDLPALPAAVEANAYRIALEALTNAARHSHARRCVIQFSCEAQIPGAGQQRALRIQISDDGVGLPETYRSGVGLRSMRERAEELGGQLTIAQESTHGMQVTARLPFIEGR